MPETVVDRLEVIEINEQDGHRAAGAFDPRQGVLDTITEERLVGKAGQSVVKRLSCQLVAELTVLRGVAETPDAPHNIAVNALR